MHAITAGGGDEQTWHDGSVGSGSIFFETLLAGLDGPADSLPPDGVVTVKELDTYLSGTISRFTDERQNPRSADLMQGQGQGQGGSPGGFFFLNRRSQFEAGNVPEWDPYGTPFGQSELPKSSPSPVAADVQRLGNEELSRQPPIPEETMEAPPVLEPRTNEEKQPTVEQAVTRLTPTRLKPELQRADAVAADLLEDLEDADEIARTKSAPGQGIVAPSISDEVEQVPDKTEGKQTRIDGKKIQIALAELGYSPGNPDGVMGSDTASAVAEFQRSVGTPATGTLAPQEAQHLLVHAAAAKGTRATLTPLLSRAEGVVEGLRSDQDRATLLASLGVAYQALAEPKRSDSLFAQADQLASRLPQVSSQAASLAAAAELRLYNKDFRGAGSTARRAAELATQLYNDGQSEEAAAMLGWLGALQHRLEHRDEAKALLDLAAQAAAQAVNDSSRSNSAGEVSMAPSFLAYMYQVIGDSEKALQAIELYDHAFSKPSVSVAPGTNAEAIALVLADGGFGAAARSALKKYYSTDHASRRWSTLAKLRLGELRPEDAVSLAPTVDLFLAAALDKLSASNSIGAIFDLATALILASEPGEFFGIAQVSIRANARNLAEGAADQMLEIADLADTSTSHQSDQIRASAASVLFDLGRIQPVLDIISKIENYDDNPRLYHLIAKVSAAVAHMNILAAESRLGSEVF